MPLSPKANKILEDYFSLPFAGITGVRCPYFNNARLKQRAQLRVLAGKGTPKEIVEEAKIISIQYQCGIFDKAGRCCLHSQCGEEKTPTDTVRKFLVDHNLGIECSGFVTQILREHFKELKGVDIVRQFYIVSPRHFLRWLISLLRPVENIGVRRYADDRNTEKINWQDAQAGDVIIMLETDAQKKRHHILLVTDRTDTVIYYAHARAWGSEGKYGHGVAKGEIRIVSPSGNLLDQNWVELEKENISNETYTEAKRARELSARKIKI